MAVYLLHFETRLHHAGHYLGYAKDVQARIAEHASGHGARLTQVIAEKGITFTVARIWPRGSRKLERQLKNQKNAPRLCPICRQAAKQKEREQAT